MCDSCERSTVHPPACSTRLSAFLLWRSPYEGNFHDRSTEWAKYSSAFTQLVEERVKSAFGFPIKGAPLISETILYLLVKGALPEFEVRRHFRHPKLEGLHLDIYIPELGVAIEYQGDQHYSSFEHLGGPDQFHHTLHRDRKKDELCHEFGITLMHMQGEVYLLSEAEIKARIRRALERRWPKLTTRADYSVPLERRRKILEWRAICEEIDAAHRKIKLAKQISFRNGGRKGFSAKNILTVYYRWRNAGRSWESLDPYHALYKRKESLIEALGLSPETIRRWFKRRGITTKAWAINHNFKLAAVSQAINAKRSGALCERILLVLAREIKAGGAEEVRNELKQMNTLSSKLQTRIAELEKLLTPP
jgi:gp16 family phage-associated protein